MSLQGITVAMSPSGLQYFTQSMLASTIAQALGSLIPPDNTISVPDICISSGKGGSSWDANISIALSGGAMHGFAPQFTSLSQGPNGQFTLVMTASNFSVSYNWNEQYDAQFCSIIGCHTMSHYNNNYAYSIGVGSMVITIVYQVQTSGTNVQLNFVSSTPVMSGLSPNIPSNSVVNDEEYSGCFSTQVSSSTANAVSQIQFGPALANLLTPLFKTIPNSGVINPNIQFGFALGPSSVTFSNNVGMAVGVTGVATYKGTQYPGANPPQLALPSVPTNNHLHYYASDYTFNSLFWAFFSDGDLVATATPGNVPIPADMNTSYYNNTPLQALFTAYPYCPMTADITALVAPTVTFQQVYDLTATNMAPLQNQLPASAWTALQLLKGSVFLQEAEFYSALQNVLTASVAAQYKTIIEAAALITGAVVTHSENIVLNVIQNGNTIPVITFKIQETDVLQNFGLGIAGTTQTLQFAFQVVPNLTTSTFISSTIPGIDSGDFGYIWNGVLQPVFANQLSKMGQTGVPLPRVQGFNFLFSGATVTLSPGYAEVFTDVVNVNDTGQVLYHMSQNRIELGEPISSHRRNVKSPSFPLIKSGHELL